ncbi:unnamed protein product [Parascedosporium putredinis]|uniref:Amino acid transporter transmembrane domain-containing protein n=1 Tax=Parascedosporium putredinis TaxID=1442378 RepID=A0A9P1H4Z2_9PEZI|nr:unnamed protein product [Parascedosporium putredinis]CAI7996389.1 unnamed protein product [Parascedosporium putredinis]
MGVAPTEAPPSRAGVDEEKVVQNGSNPSLGADVSDSQVQDPFEGEVGEIIDYKTLTWWQGGIVLIAETVSLGILSLPSVLATVGLVPGIILILFLGALSTYSGLVLGEFRKRYPYVQNFGDAVEIVGKSIACLSITTAVLITVGDVAAERPIGTGSIEVARQLGFTGAFLAVTNIAIAFSSHSCFFTVISEFKNPDDWPKALALLQIADTTIYLVAAIVIYVFVGPNVPSPALSAAGSLVVRKVIWGIAIPTIVIAGVIYGHVASAYVFSRIFRNTKHMVRRTKISTISWFAITFGAWTISMIIAESIPVFNNLLGLIGALFASWFSYGLLGSFGFGCITETGLPMASRPADSWPMSRFLPRGS